MLQGESAEGHHDRRCDQPHLLAKPPGTCPQLGRTRGPIRGRPAPNHVGDEDLIASQTGFLEHGVEQGTGSADERSAHSVFGLTGRLTDEEDARPVVTLSGDDLGSAQEEIAAGTPDHHVAEPLERGRGGIVAG